MGKNKPSKLIDWLVQALIPPSAREEVIGDLWESYSTSLRYISEGVAIMPYVVASQIRHKTIVAVLVLQGFALFACLGGFSTDPGIGNVPNWARASIPTLVVLIGLVLGDAYRIPSKKVFASGVIDAVTAAFCILLTEGTLTLLSEMQKLDKAWVLPGNIFVLTSLALPTVGILRIASGLDSQSRLASGEVDTGSLAAEYAKFKRGVNLRNCAEIAACLAVITISTYFLLRYRPPVAPAGWTMLCIWLFLTLYLGLRGWAKSLPGDTGLVPAVYKNELRRQYALRRLMWWWWFVPLFVGLGNNYILHGIAKMLPLEIAFGLVAIALLAFFIAKLIVERGRIVREEVAALNAIMK